MLQRQYCLFFLYRHKTPFLCFNVNIVCSSYFVIKRRCYATTSILFVLLFLNKTPLLCYNLMHVFKRRVRQFSLRMCSAASDPGVAGSNPDGGVTFCSLNLTIFLNFQLNRCYNMMT